MLTELRVRQPCCIGFIENSRRPYGSCILSMKKAAILRNPQHADLRFKLPGSTKPIPISMATDGCPLSPSSSSGIRIPIAKV